MIVQFSVPESRPLGPLAHAFDYSAFVPRMDDYMPEQVDLLPMAARDISEALVDVEIEIRRTASADDCVNACLLLRTFTERLLQLERLALDRAEALNKEF